MFNVWSIAWDVESLSKIIFISNPSTSSTLDLLCNKIIYCLSFSFILRALITFSTSISLHRQPDFVSPLIWNALKSICPKMCSWINISQSCSFNWYKYWGQLFPSILFPNIKQLTTDRVRSETTFLELCFEVLVFFFVISFFTS